MFIELADQEVPKAVQSNLAGDSGTHTKLRQSNTCIRCASSRMKLHAIHKREPAALGHNIDRFADNVSNKYSETCHVKQVSRLLLQIRATHVPLLFLTAIRLRRSDDEPGGGVLWPSFSGDSSCLLSDFGGFPGIPNLRSADSSR
jgi:hypothetical protein